MVVSFDSISLHSQPTCEKNLSLASKSWLEECKISIRNIRRDSNKAADVSQKDKILSEDSRDDVKDTVQKLTKSYEDKTSDMSKSREKEVMED